MSESLSDEKSLEGVEFEDSFNFKCKYYLKNLSSRQNLKEHLYIHSGTKPYKCEYEGCEKSFRQGSLLSIHKEKHIIESFDNRVTRAVRKEVAYPKLTELILLRANSADFLSGAADKESMIKKSLGIVHYNFAERFLNGLYIK